MRKTENRLKYYSFKVLKILGWIFGFLFILFVLLVLLIRSEWGQSVVVEKATAFVSKKIDTPFSIGRLYLTFTGNAYLENFYLEDQQGDTLVYSDELEASVALIPLIISNTIDVDLVDWNGLVARIKRTKKTGTFNFEYIIEAFSGPDTTAADTPDTASTSMPAIRIGRIYFSSFDLSYQDEIPGIHTTLRLGELTLKMNKLNLDQLLFDIDELTLKNTVVFYEQTQLNEGTDTANVDTTAILPTIRINELNLYQVQAIYHSPPTNLYASSTIHTLELEAPLIDLTRQEIKITRFLLTDTQARLQLYSKEPASASGDTTASAPFLWPNWKVTAQDLQVEAVSFEIELDSSLQQQAIFNPSRLMVKDLNLQIEKATLEDQKARLILDEFSFRERCGFELKQLTLDLELTDKQLTIEELELETGGSQLDTDLQLSFASMNSLIQDPLSVQIYARLSASSLLVNEVFYFVPELKSEPYLSSLASHPIQAELEMNGSREKLQLKKGLIEWNHSQVHLEGNATSVADIDQFRLEALRYDLITNRADLNALLNLDSTGLLLPVNIRLSGQTSGGLTHLSSKNQLKTSEGSILLNGQFQNEPDQIRFKGNLEAEELNLGHILQNDLIGPLTFQLSTSGQGKTLQTLDAQLSSRFDKLSYAGYDFTALKLSGSMQGGNGKADLTYKDDNLDMDLSASIKLDSSRQTVSAALDLRGADFMALGWAQNDTRARFKLQADFEGDNTSYDAHLNLTDGTVVYEQKSYPMDSLTALAHIRPDTTSLELHSSIALLDFHSNTDPASLTSAIQRKLTRYLNHGAQDSAAGNVQVRARLRIGQNPLLQEVLIPGLEEYDSISFRFTFLEAQDSIDAFLNAPFIAYSGSKVDSLHLKVTGSRDQLTFQTGWASIESDPIRIDRTSLHGVLQQQRLRVSFDARSGPDSLIHIGSEWQMQGDTLQVHLLPDTLLLNRTRWSIPANNNVSVTDQYVRFQDFTLSEHQQKLQLESVFDENGRESIKATFGSFNLLTLASFLNAKDTLAEGSMQGAFTIRNVFHDAALLADLQIHPLEVMNADLGTLTMKGSSDSESRYRFDLALKEGYADLALNGTYSPDETAAQLDMKMAIHKIETRVLEKFAPEYISKSDGYLSGNLTISGATSEPQYKGTLQFNQFSLFANTLNTGFSIENEKLSLDNKGLYFREFTIQDENKNYFQLSGEILTPQLSNPEFNLQLKAKNFLALNSDKKDNDLFYGKVAVHLDLSIKGDLEIPVIRGWVGIQEKSEFTVVVPETQADLVEREGVVVFVNKKNPDDILTRNKNEASMPTTEALKGLDVQAQLHVGKDATFKIIIDPKTGDNFQIAGVGDFDVGLEPNGSTTLSGNYTVSGGHFEASLYNLVKRRFDMAPGGIISWSGDPLEATLDVSAIYNVKTSAAPLMAVETSSSSESVSSKYQQQLPFLVYLNVKGTILQPEISFKLDMPEEKRGSLGGEVYTEVQEVNSDEEQLNKQVFSLLVLNRFFPASGSDGSSGGAASIARNNVNNVLSGQLNSLSNKLTGNSGLQLDFGLNSYTDYSGQSSQERTDLNINASKQLFNNRVIVQVGSEVNVQGSGETTADDETTPLIGNVSLEYLITENGRYRFQGFRKNEYENIIDGQLIVTGFAFIFNREFNRFKEIWKKQTEDSSDQSPQITP